MIKEKGSNDFNRKIRKKNDWVKESNKNFMTEYDEIKIISDSSSSPFFLKNKIIKLWVSCENFFVIFLFDDGLIVKEKRDKLLSMSCNINCTN